MKGDIVVDNKEIYEYTLRYRPQTLRDMLGHTAVISSLNSLLANKSTVPHAFLFSGPSGTGKTTFARIIAWELGCSAANLIEIDGATNTGIENVRDLQGGLKYKTVGKSSLKFVIIDECHMLSKSAWNALLKVTEETPKHVYFVFCTTEVDKVPKAFTDQRCTHYALKSVSMQDLITLLDFVVQEEGLKLSSNLVDTIAKASDGSPRRALNYLSKCRSCTSVAEVSELLESVESEEDVLNLCKLLVGRRPDFVQALKIVKGLKSTNFEGVRIQIFNYVTSCVMNSKSDGTIGKFLDLLDIFNRRLLASQTAKGEFLLMLADATLKE